MSQARVERERIYEAVADVGLGASVPGDGAGIMLGTTVAIEEYPTDAASWYGVQPTLVDGEQAEGEPAGLAVQAGPPVLALNIGGGVPPIGTAVICVSINGRWVFRHDG